MKDRTPEQMLEDSMTTMRKIMGWLETIHKTDSLNQSSNFQQRRFAKQLVRMHDMTEAFIKANSLPDMAALQPVQEVKFGGFHLDDYGYPVPNVQPVQEKGEKP